MKDFFANLKMLFTLRFIVSVTVYVHLLHIYTGLPSREIDKSNYLSSQSSTLETCRCPDCPEKKYPKFLNDFHNLMIYKGSRTDMPKFHFNHFQNGQVLMQMQP